MDFIIVNGQVVSAPEINLTRIYRENTCYLSGQTWFGYGGIPLLNENVDRLMEQIEKLQLPVPPVLEDKRELFRITKRMLNKNKFYRSGLVNIELFWDKNEMNSVITSKPSLHFEFPFNEQGILVNFSDHKIFSGNSFNRFSFFHAPQWKSTERDIQNSPFANSIILNEKDAVCECLRSNIYLVKDTRLLTPSGWSGAYIDIIRSSVLKLADDIGLKVHEQTLIKTDELAEMDEIFIAGEETGFHWILGVENKRYIHHYADIIHKELNEKLREKVG